MNKQRQRLQAQVGIFVQKYARKAHAGHDPNDRSYDRRVEAKIKRMHPEELDALLQGEDEEADLLPVSVPPLPDTPPPAAG